MMGHWYARGLRLSFLDWKDKTLKITLAEEVEESGPVVEEVIVE